MIADMDEISKPNLRKVNNTFLVPQKTRVTYNMPPTVAMIA